MVQQLRLDGGDQPRDDRVQLWKVLKKTCHGLCGQLAVAVGPRVGGGGGHQRTQQRVLVVVVAFLGHGLPVRVGAVVDDDGGAVVVGQRGKQRC